MTNALDTAPLHVLEGMAKGLKDGMMKVINMGANAHVGDPANKKNPPSVSFELNLALLEKVESEIRLRGFDPADSRFGPDLLGQIAQIKAEVMARNSQ